jgi:hypothetical protein
MARSSKSLQKGDVIENLYNAQAREQHREFKVSDDHQKTTCKMAASI